LFLISGSGRPGKQWEAGGLWISGSISFWGKKEKQGWWMVRKSIEYLREHAHDVENEKFERHDSVTVICGILE
jgi:hypothetical protein